MQKRRESDAKRPVVLCLCSRSQLLYNFRERRFVLVHHLRGKEFRGISYRGTSVSLAIIRRRRCRSVPRLQLDYLARPRLVVNSRGGSRAVSLPRSLVRDVCPRAPLAALVITERFVCATETAYRVKEMAQWQCRNLAHLTVLMPRSKKLRRSAIWKRTNVSSRSVP